MRIVIFGSGVMGAGIALLVANSGFKVNLLDIVPNDSLDRNILAKNAIAKLDPLKPENLIPGNIEDDLNLIKDAEWVVEAIIEKLEIKQELYKKLEKLCSKDCVISSNTSTILLKDLIDGRGEEFKKNFLITHFFNPPRYMELLELVVSDYTDKKIIKKITNFLDVNLGKTIVKSNDTPGFIANRIGCYWLETALTTAIEMRISIQEADNLMGEVIGIPRTAVFGLYDLIGIDVMQLIVHSLKANLLKEDDFNNVSKKHLIIEKMIKENNIGRKTGSGFYKIIKNKDRSKDKFCIDLSTGEYNLCKNIAPRKDDIKTLFENNPYVSQVLTKVLNYVESLIPEVTDNIYDIDQAMKLGYNWKFGPFELLDKIKDRKFYKDDSFFNGEEYVSIPRPEGIIYLKDYQDTPPIYKNNSANIWDIGDEVVAIEFTSKMAMTNHEVFELILDFFDKKASNFKAIVIANNQANFSVGGNLQFMLDMVLKKKWSSIEDYLKLGAEAMLAIKYSDIPVVSALKGMALGGGAELLLHSYGVIAHIETNSGLVESGVGLIPGWGGCKELLLRTKNKKDRLQAFENIVKGKISSGAYELQDMLQFKNYKITANINRVLADAKNMALSYKIEKNDKFIPIKLEDNIIDNFSGYDGEIAKELANLFNMNETSEEKLMQKEREIFLNLLHNKSTIDRIEYMLKTGKRLIN
ncbi:MAG: 3-hydroxyacyl-CoA dehydrogenase NAD-binding domain-containing protein [Pseudomonadota bacterium]